MFVKLSCVCLALPLGAVSVTAFDAVSISAQGLGKPVVRRTVRKDSVVPDHAVSRRPAPVDGEAIMDDVLTMMHPGSDQASLATGSANVSNTLGKCRPIFGDGELSDPDIVVTTLNAGNSNSEETCHALVGSPTWDYTAKNIAYGKKWTGFRVKVKYMVDWLPDVPDNKIVVFVDGSDVLYGGCSKKEFISRFEKLVDATGAKVLFGAERTCYDSDNKHFSERVRNASMKAMNIRPEQISAEEWSTSPSDTSPITDHEQIFLNSGFVVGRAGDLKKVYQRWLTAIETDWSAGERYKHATKLCGDIVPFGTCNKGACTDQIYAYKVFSDSPDLVSLDYTGALVSNMYGLRSKGASTKKAIFHWNGQKLINNALGMDVCFAHGNGQDKRLKEISKITTPNTDTDILWQRPVPAAGRHGA